MGEEPTNAKDSFVHATFKIATQSIKQARLWYFLLIFKVLSIDGSRGVDS